MNYNGREKKKERTLCDEEIIDLYWARDERAIKETEIKYGKYLYVIAYNILHDRMDCEECVSDTYLGTWNSIPPTRPTAFGAYLARITRNKAIKYYRRNTAAKRIPGELIVSLDELEKTVEVPSKEEDEALELLRSVLGRFIDGLNEREEFIFVCRYYYCDGVPYIARLLRLSERCVYRELERMRGELKRMMEEARDE